MTLGVYDVEYRSAWKVRLLIGDGTYKAAVKQKRPLAILRLRLMIRANVRQKYDKHLDMFTDGLEGVTFFHRRYATFRDRIDYIRGKELAD